MPTQPEKTNPAAQSGYASINGLQMYYEMEGQGKPLVYVPPAFGFAGMKSFPGLNQIRTVITPDLQGHGRTADIDRPMTLEQSAEDVVALLDHLKIKKADFLGESFGAVIAALIALRYPERVDKVAVQGAVFSSPLEAVRAEVLQTAGAPEGRGIQYQRENYERVAPNPGDWSKIYAKVGGQPPVIFTQEQLASIKAPFLMTVGDHDFVRLEHAVKMFNSIPNAQLAVIPDASHFVLFSEPEKIIPVIARFLEGPSKTPLATAAAGYHPGETR